VESAQKRVEQRNYLSRKHVLEYDDVMNQQREVIYSYRNEVLESPDPRLLIDEMLEKAVPGRVEEFVTREPVKGEEPNYSGLLNWLNTTFPLGLSAKEAALDTRDFDENCRFIIERIKRAYDLKTSGTPPQFLEDSERITLLEAIDELWQEHLYAIDGLREGVRLRSYGQKDPLIEYKQEAYEMFDQLMRNVNNKALANLFTSASRLQAWLEHIRTSLMQARTISNETPAPQPKPAAPASSSNSGDAQKGEDASPKITVPLKRDIPKVGRNDPCPCGSGKKYKACHGRTA